jgi:serine protease Do
MAGAAHGAAFTFAPTPTPPPVDGPTKRTVLSKVVSDLQEGDSWGQFRIGMFCIPFGGAPWPAESPVFKGDDLDKVFAREMKTAGFSDGSDELFANPDEAELDYAIGARIKAADGRVCGWANPNGPPLWKGTMVLTIQWQIYERARRRVVATVETTAGYEVRDFSTTGNRSMLIESFGQNARALAAADEFRKIFIIPPQEARAQQDRTAAKTPILVAGLGQGRPPPIAEATGSVVVVHASGGMGSAFLVSPDGYLLTNAHVVGTDAKVRVHWSDGFETEGEVVRVQKARDVALVRTGPHGRTPLPLRTAKATPGEAVFAIGAPLQEALQGTVTKGIVSANRILDGFSFIQSDVAVTHGNSGGPLLDEKGLVIGLTDLGYRPDGVPENINFFIPIGDALDFLNLKPAP